LESGGNNDGLAVHVFTNPVLALENFQKNPQGYVIVISDIRMPGMSGFQLVRAIRTLNSSVKVILVSSFEMNRSEIAKELGFDDVDFLQKPVGIAQLRNVVMNHLAKSSNARGLL
jgi:CheY-like chemotaxis protein